MRSFILLALLVASTGCVRRYELAPPLEFDQLPYQSLDGRPWPQRLIELERTGQKYGLGQHATVSVIEFNPQGQQVLLFLHGLGSYVSFWRYQLDEFAGRGYRVVAFDMLGFGKSDKPGAFPYTMDAMAEVVDEVMDTLAIEKATVVGHSMGGEVAMATAIRFPARVERLVLTSPAGFEAFSPHEKQWFKKVISTAFIKSADEYAIWGSVRSANFQRWRPELGWLIEERVRLKRARSFDAYAYAQVQSIEGLAHNDFVRDNLSRIAVPTVIIFGEEDRLIPNPFLHGGRTRGVMEYGAQHIPGATLKGLGGCGHTVQMDCPQAYNEAVAGFLTAVTSSEDTTRTTVEPPTTP